MNKRQAEIILLADKLRREHYSEGQVNLESLAQENGITIFSDRRMYIPIALYQKSQEGIRRTIGMDSQISFKGVYDFCLAHEIGHHLLLHHKEKRGVLTEEREANMFASYLLGVKKPNLLLGLDTFLKLLKRPSIVFDFISSIFRLNPLYFIDANEKRLKLLMGEKT